MTRQEVTRYRESLGMKQADFADLLHVSQAAVSQWESGVRRITPAHAELIRMKVAERQQQQEAVQVVA